MLLRYAKLAGGLRILIAQAAPLVVVSVSHLSLRSAAYLVGFTLSSISASLLPIVITLIAISGIFGSASTAECEAYFEEVKRIDDYNRVLMENYQAAYKIWANGPYKDYTLAMEALYLSATQQSEAICAALNLPESVSCVVCGGGGILGSINSCVVTTCFPRNECQNSQFNRLNTGISMPDPPPLPDFLNYDGVSTPPDCPANKKVWLQTMWVSPSEFASQSKGCFLIGYSHNTLDGLKIEYNPFKIPEEYLISNALPHTLVFGNRFRGLTDEDWEDLESVGGWDKGYWASEFTDVECRGWRPGWSNKIK